MRNQSDFSRFRVIYDGVPTKSAWPRVLVFSVLGLTVGFRVRRSVVTALQQYP